MIENQTMEEHLDLIERLNQGFREAHQEELQAQCPYMSICRLPLKGKMCIFDESIQNCQSFKFYQKYPNYSEMFMGSRI
jgi:hypothetical protein